MEDLKTKLIKAVKVLRLLPQCMRICPLHMSRSHLVILIVQKWSTILVRLPKWQSIVLYVFFSNSKTVFIAFPTPSPSPFPSDITWKHVPIPVHISSRVQPVGGNLNYRAQDQHAPETSATLRIPSAFILTSFARRCLLCAEG